MNRRFLLSIFPFSLFAGKVKAEPKSEPGPAFSVKPIQATMPPGVITFTFHEKEMPDQDYIYFYGILECSDSRSSEKIRWRAIESPGVKKGNVADRRNSLRTFYEQLGLAMLQLQHPHDTLLEEFEYDYGRQEFVLGKAPHFLSKDGTKNDIHGNPI